MRKRKTVADQDGAGPRRRKPEPAQADVHAGGPAHQSAVLPAARALLTAGIGAEQGLAGVPAATIQRLQREYGNQAVGLVIQRRHHRHGGAAMAAPPQQQQATMRVQLQDRVNTHHTVVLNADANTGVAYAALSAALDALSEHAPNATIRRAMREAVDAQKTYWQGQVNPAGVAGANDSRSEYFGERGGWRVDVENIRGVNLKR
jgi:hypothetical protein